ncbi:MAG: leucine-rich repeat domain-containing protein [Candidatus Ornithomonoglobus sp.]
MGGLLFAGMIGAAVYFVYRERAANQQKRKESCEKELKKQAEETKRMERWFTRQDAEKLLSKQNGNIDIPYGVTEICDRAFDRNENLISMSVPSSVKIIGDRAFADCKNLKRVELEEGLESIGSNAFTGCASLHELVIPDIEINIGLGEIDYEAIAERLFPMAIEKLREYSGDNILIKTIGRMQFVPEGLAASILSTLPQEAKDELILYFINGHRDELTSMINNFAENKQIKISVANVEIHS